MHGGKASDYYSAAARIEANKKGICCNFRDATQSVAQVSKNDVAFENNHDNTHR